jgi:FMN-dependent NADH-azoreductase
MSKILFLDASPRGDRSVSRMLAGEFMDGWKQAHPDDSVVYHDLGREPVPHVTEAWVEGAYNAPDKRSPAAVEAMAVSDALVDELLAADRIVIGTPMYNLNVPSTLKAWIDQIVRVGRTFSMEMAGLVKDKKLLVVTARGGIYKPGTPFADYDMQEPYLRAIFGFIGVTDATFVNCEGINAGDELRTEGIAASQARLTELVNTW